MDADETNKEDKDNYFSDFIAQLEFTKDVSNHSPDYFTQHTFGNSIPSPNNAAQVLKQMNKDKLDYQMDNSIQGDNTPKQAIQNNAEVKTKENVIQYKPNQNSNVENEVITNSGLKLPDYKEEYQFNNSTFPVVKNTSNISSENTIISTNTQRSYEKKHDIKIIDCTKDIEKQCNTGTSKKKRETSENIEKAHLTLGDIIELKSNLEQNSKDNLKHSSETTISFLRYLPIFTKKETGRINFKKKCVACGKITGCTFTYIDHKFKLKNSAKKKLVNICDTILESTGTNLEEKVANIKHHCIECSKNQKTSSVIDNTAFTSNTIPKNEVGSYISQTNTIGKKRNFNSGSSSPNKKKRHSSKIEEINGLFRRYISPSYSIYDITTCNESLYILAHGEILRVTDFTTIGHLVGVDENYTRMCSYKNTFLLFNNREKLCCYAFNGKHTIDINYGDIDIPQMSINYALGIHNTASICICFENSIYIFVYYIAENKVLNVFEEKHFWNSNIIDAVYCKPFLFLADNGNNRATIWYTDVSKCGKRENNTTYKGIVIPNFTIEGIAIYLNMCTGYLVAVGNNGGKNESKKFRLLNGEVTEINTSDINIDSNFDRRIKRVTNSSENLYYLLDNIEDINEEPMQNEEAKKKNNGDGSFGGNNSGSGNGRSSGGPFGSSQDGPFGGSQGGSFGGSHGSFSSKNCNLQAGPFTYLHWSINFMLGQALRESNKPSQLAINKYLSYMKTYISKINTENKFFQKKQNTYCNFLSIFDNTINSIGRQMVYFHKKKPLYGTAQWYNKKDNTIIHPSEDIDYSKSKLGICSNPSINCKNIENTTLEDYKHNICSISIYGKTYIKVHYNSINDYMESLSDDELECLFVYLDPNENNGICSIITRFQFMFESSIFNINRVIGKCYKLKDNYWTYKSTNIPDILQNHLNNNSNIAYIIVELFPLSNEDISSYIYDYFRNVNPFSLGLYTNEYNNYTLDNDNGLIDENYITITTENTPNINKGCIYIINHDIEKLNLSSNNLSGKLEDNLSYLSKLEVLNLSKNNIKGRIPNSIGDLKSIKSIDLSDNIFDGCIPSSFENLTTLKCLVLDNNKLTEIPENINSLTNLIILSINDNNIGEINSFDNLFNLLVLNIRNNLLKDIPNTLGTLTKLEEIDFSVNKLTQLPDCMKNLTNLQIFNIANNNINSTISNDYFKNFCQLEELNISFNMFSGNLPLSVFTNDAINYLYLNNNQFSGKLSEVYSSSLLYLDISHNKLSGTIPHTISNCVNLKNLNLSYNELTGELISEVLILPNIEYMNLSHNKLSGKIPDNIKTTFPLNLSFNKELTGTIDNQQRIDIQSTQIQVQG